MENVNPEGLTQPQKRPKGIKTADVKRLKREGHSVPAICNKLGISYASVTYHLRKKRKDTGVPRVKTAVVAESIGFEAELFGTIIKLDKVPAMIERIGNRIIIK